MPLLTEALRGRGRGAGGRDRRTGSWSDAPRRRTGPAGRGGPGDLGRAGQPGSRCSSTPPPPSAGASPSASPRCSTVPRGRHRPAAGTRAGGAGRPLPHGRGGHRPRRALACPGCGRWARWPAPACTARTAWRATRCWRPLVFGARRRVAAVGGGAGRRPARRRGPPPLPAARRRCTSDAVEESRPHCADDVERVGVVRDGDGLAARPGRDDALAALRLAPRSSEPPNMVAPRAWSRRPRCARAESRGAHYAPTTRRAIRLGRVDLDVATGRLDAENDLVAAPPDRRIRVNRSLGAAAAALRTWSDGPARGPGPGRRHHHRCRRARRRQPGPSGGPAAGRVAGLEVALPAPSRLLDSGVSGRRAGGDGDDVPPGRRPGRGRGPGAGDPVPAERMALNLLGRLCGIATGDPRRGRSAVDGPQARSSAPARPRRGCGRWRSTPSALGGGGNHRFGLDDAVLIKDNHVAVAGGDRAAVERARRRAWATWSRSRSRSTPWPSSTRRSTPGPRWCCSTT